MSDKHLFRTASADRVSNEYCDAVAKLPLLSVQGDGMRSFASLLFALEAMQSSILLIDEPEAFLHPPQARRIGEIIANAQRKKRQTIVATHSTDVLRGILASGRGNTKIVRLSRATGQSTTVLEPSAIAELWSDPILRFSNALDGLFHEATVLCESDADCRFYEAMASAIASTQASANDMHFTYTAGKDRLPIVQRALKTLGVTVIVIADFDVLQHDTPILQLVQLETEELASLQIALRTIRTAIDGKLPTLSRSALAREVPAILASSDRQTLTEDDRDQIRNLLKGTSLWSMAKTMGKTYLSGEPAKQAESLLEKLRDLRVFVVPVGELESFCRTIGSHGPRWVAEVLRRPLKDDPELHDARKFVEGILGHLLLS